MLLSFTFNAYSENTYLLADTITKECAIIDPGNATQAEWNELSQAIEDHGFTPTLLLNTHCHIDHILGNRKVADKYGLKLHAHPLEVPILHQAPIWADMMGVEDPDSPPIEVELHHNTILYLGKLEIKVLHVPGHSPGSVVFSIEREGYVVAGDTLFRESVGRTDLPGGEPQTLMNSIRAVLYALPLDTKVYPGHGPSTTIGWEMIHNPYCPAEAK